MSEDPSQPQDDAAEGESVDARYPAIARLGQARKKKRLPFVQQLTGSDCGAASLAMVLAYHGKVVPLEDLREASGASRDGANALAIMNTARLYGMRGRGVAIDIDDLEYLPPATILHWGFDHFLVYERTRGELIELVDPALGRRRVTMEEFRKEFTGVALLLEPAEDFEPGGGERRAGSYAKKLLRHSGLLWRIGITTLLIQLFMLALPILTGALVDRVVPRRDHHLLLVLGIGLGALVVFQFLASQIRAHLLLHLRTHLDARMTIGFLDHLVSLPYAFFQRRATGDLMMRLNSNTTIREIMTSGALSALLDGSMVTLYLLILLIASPSLGLLVVGLGALQVGVFVLLRRRQADLMAKSLGVEAKAQSYEVELLSGIETLKAMGGEQRAVERWSDLFVNVLNISLERGRLDALMHSLNDALRLASPLAILFYGGSQVLGGHMSLGTMLGLSALASAFLGPLAALVGTAMQFQLLGGYLERINDVLESPPEQDLAKVRQIGRLRGRITLDRVSFRYAPLAPIVVQEVSVDIQPGQFVAVVGRSGAGKSTLASLIVGLHQPTQGKIFYDGQDLAELDVRSVRRQLGIVTQQAYLFGASIRENIALADPALPLERVMAAANLARIHDEIVAMPMGYDTMLIDRGASLSGGQRQRVALARALVGNPTILLLDEGTSALDAVTERDVQHALAGLRCTRVVIAHRLSTVIRADQILVMDEGRLVEVGKHHELLARRGAYARLVAAQLEDDD